MSKAFTRESDDAPEQLLLRPQLLPLPPGVKNYITPDGAKRLHEELDHLVQAERPRVATALEANDSKRQLQVLDQRIAHLHQSLQSAIIVPPPAVPEIQVRFGAMITVRNRAGKDERYRNCGH